MSVTRPMMKGADVTAVQQKLAELGYAVGTIDGTYGPTTDAAVRAFQRDRGLHVDGVVGPEVRAALAGTAGSTQFERVA